MQQCLTSDEIYDKTFGKPLRFDLLAMTCFSMFFTFSLKRLYINFVHRRVESVSHCSRTIDNIILRPFLRIVLEISNDFEF